MRIHSIIFLGRCEEGSVKREPSTMKYETQMIGCNLNGMEILCKRNEHNNDELSFNFFWAFHQKENDSIRILFGGKNTSNTTRLCL